MSSCSSSTGAPAVLQQYAQVFKAQTITPLKKPAEVAVASAAHVSTSVPQPAITSRGAVLDVSA